MDADTAAVGSDKMELTKKTDDENRGRHEAIHAISYAFRIFTIDQPTMSFFEVDHKKYKAQFEYKDHYLYLRNVYRWFLEQIAEGKLDAYNTKIDPRSGHPDDNEEEFFASLINSLFIQQPEKVFREKDAVFLKLYGEVLLKTYERLNYIPQLKNAPIMKKLLLQRLLVRRFIREKDEETKRAELVKAKIVK